MFPLIFLIVNFLVDETPLVEIRVNLVSSIECVDLDFDGESEIFVFCEVPGKTQVLKMFSQRFFVPIEGILDNYKRSSFFKATFFDYNKDSFPDLFCVTDFDERKLTILTNKFGFLEEETTIELPSPLIKNPYPIHSSNGDFPILIVPLKTGIYFLFYRNQKFELLPFFLRENIARFFIGHFDNNNNLDLLLYSPPKGWILFRNFLIENVSEEVLSSTFNVYPVPVSFDLNPYFLVQDNLTGKIWLYKRLTEKTPVEVVGELQDFFIDKVYFLGFDPISQQTYGFLLSKNYNLYRFWLNGREVRLKKVMSGLRDFFVISSRLQDKMVLLALFPSYLKLFEVTLWDDRLIIDKNLLGDGHENVRLLLYFNKGRVLEIRDIWYQTALKGRKTSFYLKKVDSIIAIWGDGRKDVYRPRKEIEIKGKNTEKKDKSFYKIIKSLVPNPTRNYTVLVYQLEKETQVEISIRTFTGQLKKLVDKGSKTRGKYTMFIDVSDLLPGNYLIQVVTPDEKEQIKLTIIR